MKKVADSKKREILSFEKKTISDLRLKRVQGGECILPKKESHYRCLL